MRFRRRRAEQHATPMPSLAALVLHDGMITAVLKGAHRARVPDIQPHPFDGGEEAMITMLQHDAAIWNWTSAELRRAVLRRATAYPVCVICRQIESHPLHVGERR